MWFVVNAYIAAQYYFMYDGFNLSKPCISIRGFFVRFVVPYSMKKLLVILAITATLTSCKKDTTTGQNCWRCQLAGVVNGVDYTGQYRTVCGSQDVTDAAGNNIAKPGGCVLVR